MKNYVLLLIFILSLFANSCNNGDINSSDENDYILLEIRRHTDGTALDDTYGYVHIDFAGYQYEESNGNLYVSIILDHDFNMDSPFRVICAMERSLSGDLGSGFAGGIYPIDATPTVIPIMTFPLPGQDSLIINDIFPNGVVEFLFKNVRITIHPQNENIIEENNQDITTIFGRFNIQDQITIISRGFLMKENIIWP
jgi:hypothetical protein